MRAMDILRLVLPTIDSPNRTHRKLGWMRSHIQVLGVEVAYPQNLLHRHINGTLVTWAELDVKEIITVQVGDPKSMWIHTSMLMLTQMQLIILVKGITTSTLVLIGMINHVRVIPEEGAGVPWREMVPVTRIELSIADDLVSINMSLCIHQLESNIESISTPKVFRLMKYELK